MKQATLTVEVAGRRAGSAANVVSEGDRTLLLEDGNGQFQVTRDQAAIVPSAESTANHVDAVGGSSARTGKSAAEKVRDLVDIQGQDGNWNYNAYMHGLHAGLETALAVIEDRKPEFKENNETYLSDPSRKPPVIVPRLEVDEPTEKAARFFYDNYTAATGGITPNGDKLPAADEFFEDPTKQKSANAWRTLAGNAIQLLHDAGILVDDGSDEEDTLTEIKDTGEAGQEEADKNIDGSDEDL